MRSVVALAVVLFATAVSMSPLGGARVIQILPEPRPESPDNWFKNLPDAKPKYTELKIFIHYILQGDDASVAPVAQANVTSTSPTRFGLMAVVDDPLTQGQELSSETVGHAEGTIVYGSKETVSVIFSGSFAFTAGQYKGSSLSVLGRISSSSTDSNNEFPVSGGSGYFRLAQGIVNTHVLPPDAQGTVAVECRFKLVHY